MSDSVWVAWGQGSRILMPSLPSRWDAVASVGAGSALPRMGAKSASSHNSVRSAIDITSVRGATYSVSAINLVSVRSAMGGVVRRELGLKGGSGGNTAVPFLRRRLGIALFIEELT